MIGVKLVRNPKAKRVDDYGDILYPFKNWNSTSTGDNWFSHSPDNDDRKCLPLAFAHHNSWEAMNILQFDVEPLKTQLNYVCPFTHYQHSWAVPIAIAFQNDAVQESFLKTHSKVLPSWTFCQVPKELRRNKILDSMLGAGYTDMTFPNDGSGSVYRSIVKTSDEKLDVIFMTWVWYNK